MIEAKNAIIKSATLSSDDHGLLSSFIHLDYGFSGQGFGGYALYLPAAYKHSLQSQQANFAGRWIWRVMEIAGVSEWSKLPGRTIRVKCEHARVHEIGHIIKDDWFNPETDFKAMAGEN